ncbi:MAG: S41 family peptidase [Spirochaetales bacterium]|jgi:carboxyl-terminal processing protease|nr:S41 family peptidase [Spirochaetales bacterium]
MKEKKVPWTFLTGILAGMLIFALVTAAPLAAESRDGKTQRLLYLFQYVLNFVQNNYVDEVDPDVLMEGAYKGLFESLDDPHSAYLTAADMRGLRDTTSGEFGGVGLFINKQFVQKPAEGQAEPSYVEVVASIENTPAYKAGILAGDLIVKVEGDSTGGLSLDEVVDKLRGPVGSAVNITIRRGPSYSFDVALTRAKIQVPTVTWAMLPGGTAYMRIIQFTPYTAEKTAEAVAFFAGQNYKNMIIDLRGNPGGLLDSVVNVADLFFDDGVIVSTRSRLESENKVFPAKSGVIVPENLPLVVLIDGNSASAAEIFAGAVKDRGRGFLMGAKTYGKGSVQQVHAVGKGGFRLTMSRYYTPNGISIDKTGIAPDKEVKEPEFTEAESADFGKLLTARVISQFAKDTAAPTEAQTASFTAELRKAYPALSERLLRRLIRAEINRHLTTPPVYDLEYDTVLQEAVKHLSAR